MRFLLALIVLFQLFACIGPQTREDPMEEELVAFCSEFLELYSNRCFDETEALFAPKAVVAIDGVDKNRQMVLTAEEFMARTRKGGTFKEWISEKPVVLRDHHMACVWAPYLVEQEGKLYSGIDLFQLIKLEGEWRIAGLSYTNRAVQP